MSEEKKEPAGQTAPKDADKLGHIINRKDDKIKKLESEKGETAEQLKALTEQFEAFKAQSQGQDLDAVKKELRNELKRDTSIDSFATNNPQFKDHADTVRELYAQGHVSGDVKIENAFYMAAGDSLMSMGADQKQKAVAEAKAEKSGGTPPPSNDDSGATDWSKATPAELKAAQQKVLAGGMIQR